MGISVEHEKKGDLHSANPLDAAAGLRTCAADRGAETGRASLRERDAAEAARRERPIEWKEAKALSGKVVIPGCMAEICDRLFFGNKAITAVVVPGTVKHIGEYAFTKCTGLQRVILEEGIEEIDNGVFSGCTQLKNIVFPDSVRHYRGLSVVGTDLESPVTNASGTVLVFCPAAVAGTRWRIPETVRVIASQAFFRLEALEEILLPEGLEEIREGAFYRCGFTEVVIPTSVKSIQTSAFSDCERLETVTLLNGDTKIAAGAFTGCKALKEIRSDRTWAPDEEYHMRGLSFLSANASERGNLRHTADPRFGLLASRCAKGDAQAMNRFAEWFDQWSRKPGASPFYRRAANYWRYRAYQRGDEAAKAWFEKWFASHPGERLEAIMPEYEDRTMNLYTYYLSGGVLSDLGFSFFKPDRNYDLKSLPNEGIVEVSALESYEGPDEDGFGAEWYYDWWYLDENLQRIPGVEVINATHRDKRSLPQRFDEALATAREFVAARRKDTARMESEQT